MDHICKHHKKIKCSENGILQAYCGKCGKGITPKDELLEGIENIPIIEDIQKENNLLVLEKEQPTATKVIECPVCKGRGLMHTEEGSSLVDCDNCNSTGKIEIGS